MQVRLPRF